MTTFTKLKPFVKWAGGKRGLLHELLARLPDKFNNYFEPFVGGGALFFELKRLGLLENKTVYLLDKNAELINTYQVIKNYPNDLIQALAQFQKNHSKEFYYGIRALDRNTDFKSLDSIYRAARFIYLNKTCFNGLYRVNSKGFFNVPIGSYTNPCICDAETITITSEALQQVEIIHSCYSSILRFAKKDDFIYFDPPYYPLNATSNFTAYGKDVFLEAEQVALFETFKTLDSTGCFVMHSNSNSDFIKSLYRDYLVEFVEMERFINSKANGRGKIKEVIFRNYSDFTSEKILSTTYIWRDYKLIKFFRKN
jgi:DNA adenine methylase